MSSTETRREPSEEGRHSPVEGPVLIHVWLVDPAQRELAVQHLRNMLGGIVSEPGFVSARMLQSVDGSSIAAAVEMRTVEDRQRLGQLPQVRETLDHLPGTINVMLRLYHQVEAYHA